MEKLNLLMISEIQSDVSVSVRHALKALKEMDIPEEKAKELIDEAVEVGFWTDKKIKMRLSELFREIADSFAQKGLEENEAD